MNTTEVPERWCLDESEAALLHHLTSPDDDGDYSPITLRIGYVRDDDGTVRHGLLASYTDYPEEGATLLVECPPTTRAALLAHAAQRDVQSVELPEPAAYLYTLEYGQTVADTKLSIQQLNYPFGVCGSDYLARNDEGVSYVRQTPLYTDAREAAGYERGREEADRLRSVSPPTVLPDGSAFAVASFPLPKDHWLYAPSGDWDNDRDEYAECPEPILANALRAYVTAAARYAIRGATMCGQETDFDPDALVLNVCYALCGPAGGAALRGKVKP